jgi:hypothetical protein
MAPAIGLFFRQNKLLTRPKGACAAQKRVLDYWLCQIGSIPAECLFGPYPVGVMGNFYVPYSGQEPAAVSIKGHRFIILSREPDILEDGLNLLGADRLKKIESPDPYQENYFLDDLAKRINGGIVIAPYDVELGDVLANLESELPWLQ